MINCIEKKTIHYVLMIRHAVVDVSSHKRIVCDWRLFHLLFIFFYYRDHHDSYSKLYSYIFYKVILLMNDFKKYCI